MGLLKTTRGQFIPISAMIMFTIVVFMVAMVNVYKVSRAKLKIQNLADAAALNLASQQAQAYNIVADRNEWMNHMIAGAPSPNDAKAPEEFKDCSIFTADRANLIPGISCIENTASGKDTQNVAKRHIFHSEAGAKNYAQLIQTMNEAQQLFVGAYNSFLGASSQSDSRANFQELLKKDIPDLKDPSIRMIAWNSKGSESSSINTVKNMDLKSGGTIRSNMESLRFDVDHDIQTRYFVGKKLPGIPLTVKNAAVEETTLGKLYYGNGSARPVGWMVPRGMPEIEIKKGGSTANTVGVGVFISKTVQLPIVGAVPVEARAKAYVVSGSGESGTNRDGAPKFQPTYWAKLAN